MYREKYNPNRSQVKLEIGMATGELTTKESGAAKIRIIFLLFLYANLVTSQHSDDKATAAAPPPPQLPYSSPNSCPDHLTTNLLDALVCTLPPPPTHDDGDLNPVTDMMSGEKMALTEAVVLALLASRNEKGTQWEIVLILIFPSAVCALLFSEIWIRNLCPRFVLEKLIAIFFVNGVMAFLLPADCLWIPLFCFASSLLTIIIVPFLP